MANLSDLDWDDLRYFLAAYDAGTLSAAAKTLGVAQATMSRRIGALESRIGVVLFDRAVQGLRPTDAAHLLRPHVEAMEGAAHDAHTALRGLETEVEGVVSIAMPPGLAVDILRTLLPVVRERYPKLRLEIQSGNTAVDLVRREADIALRVHRPTHNDLVFRRLPDVVVGAFAHPDYVASIGVGTPPNEVDWVQYSTDMLHIPFAQWVEQARGERPCAFSSNSFLAMREATRCGAGAMLLPAAQALPFGLVPLDWIDVNLPDIPWYLVVHRALRHVPRVRAMIDLITAHSAAWAN